MKNKSILSTVFLASLLISGQATAELIDQRKKNERQETQVDNTTKVVPVYAEKAREVEIPGYLPVFVRSDHDSLAQPMEGFANDITLDMALQMILPGFKVEDKLGKPVMVSFESAGTRRQTLDSIRTKNTEAAVVVHALTATVTITDKFKVQRVLDVPVEKEWAVRVSDTRLSIALARWAKESGYTFKWDADRHVMISASSTFYGSFEEVLSKVLATPGIKNSEYPLEACIYANNPPLVRITRLGDQTQTCN